MNRAVSSYGSVARTEPWETDFFRPTASWLSEARAGEMPDPPKLVPLRPRAQLGNPQTCAAHAHGVSGPRQHPQPVPGSEKLSQSSYSM